MPRSAGVSRGDVEGSSVPGEGAGDVLESRPSVTTRLAGEWWRLPRWRRRLLVALALLAVGSLVVPFTVSRTRAWVSERSLRDRVDVRAGIAISASSSSPPGGRVDFYVSVRNVGPRPVRVTGVEITDIGLRVRARNVPPEAIRPGERIGVPVSVRLDCIRRPELEAADHLRGVLVVVPGTGRQRRVETSFSPATLLTAAVDTLCRVRPDLRGAELSGPLL